MNDNTAKIAISNIGRSLCLEQKRGNLQRHMREEEPPIILRYINRVEKWAHHAACKDVQDPDIFYRNSKQNIEKAKEFCDRCSVRRQCLDQGMEEGDGIWGGQTTKQRKQLRRDPQARLHSV